MGVTVGIRELRENLSSYIDRASSGEEIVITDRGKRVARIVGPSKLDRLIAEGRARPARTPKEPIDLDTLPVLEAPPTLSDVVIRDKQ